MTCNDNVTGLLTQTIKQHVTSNSFIHTQNSKHKCVLIKDVQLSIESEIWIELINNKSLSVKSSEFVKF